MPLLSCWLESNGNSQQHGTKPPRYRGYTTSTAFGCEQNGAEQAHVSVPSAVGSGCGSYFGLRLAKKTARTELYDPSKESETAASAALDMNQPDVEFIEHHIHAKIREHIRRIKALTRK